MDVLRSTSAEVTGAGDLAEEDVEEIRPGRIADPSVGQVTSLGAAFGVSPAYLLDKKPSVIDEKVLEALADDTAGAIFRESARLPEQDKRIVLGPVQQLASRLDAEDAQ
jgi:hypothetical protein